MYSWVNLRDLILKPPDLRKKVDIFALSIYGLVIFPKALRHIDKAVTDLFDRLDKRVTPIPTILAETFRYLSLCRRAVKLLLVWLHGYFWKVDKVSYRVFSESYSPLKEEVAMQRKDDILEERWMAILQNLKEEDIGWRAFWMVPDEILYRCGNFDCYKLRQFIQETYGLAQCDFSYKVKNYKKRVREIYDAWKKTRQIKRLAVGSMTTPEYNEWFRKRINDNIPGPSLEGSRSMEEYLQVVSQS
ncbi:coiled-coil domain-containing protein 102A-like protein [Gossypium australe]|uniref:Coiled-coil domain-containing protein 102A-like protein n=1 Tax=Gossypium australe TaxID=47621 RepID=A0A5B6WE74_9ROSI|nr:coiled-coil domain-containing protein 102A-like protein [Gossypium australe]